VLAYFPEAGKKLPMLSLQHLAGLAARHAEALEAHVAEFDIRGRVFSWNSTPAVMGVINLSPGSWYRESVCLSTEAALERARLLAAQGADLVDLGAESTLAHTPRESAVSQQRQLIPLVGPLAGEGLRVSVETYHASVARACLEAGAAVINLTGTAEAEAIFDLAASHQAAVILCYLESGAAGNVREVGDFNLQGDPVDRMLRFFEGHLRKAEACGLKRILLDPGLGFYYRNLQDSAVRVRHQISVFLQTFRLRTLGYPVCHALPHAFEFFGEEVRTAESFFAVLAALGKTDLFRTHEVPKIRGVLRTLQAYG
jgi:dihydropteroate synthase